jgi:hypothetical protein
MTEEFSAIQSTEKFLNHPSSSWRISSFELDTLSGKIKNKAKIF